MDFAQAAIGPGIAIFTRYARVLEADGSPMPVRTALVEINRMLDETLARQKGGLDPDTRFCAVWYGQYSVGGARLQRSRSPVQRQERLMGQDEGWRRPADRGYPLPGAATGAPAMSPELIAIIAAAVMILGFLWNLHRDGADMRERMARLKGLIGRFARREPPRCPHSGGPISEPPFAGRKSTRSH